MNIDGDIVYSGCNGEMFTDGVIMEKGVGGNADEDDGMVNESDKSSTNRITRTVLTYSHR